ncbi:MAG: hypothetical protein ACYC36_02560 [Bellilinea sp.]
MNHTDMLRIITEQVGEIAARSRRTETSLHKVREHLGMEPAKDSIRVIGTPDGLQVEVPGYDVTLSQIRNALINVGMFVPGKQVLIACRDRGIATVSFAA